MEYIIETKGLTKKFGSKCAVNNMSVHIRKGDIYGLIGKNGAGKTTLLRMILGLSVPTAGKISVFGKQDNNPSKNKIGSLIEAPALYKGESAFENMKRFAILSPTTDPKIKEILKLVGLGDVGKKKVRAFSLGMKQRLGIAIALLGEPEILILDEPINGLDPEGIRDIRNLILELNKQGVTFVISSHLLDELGKIATKYGILSRGVLTEEITAEELAATCISTVNIEVDDEKKAKDVLRNAFEGMPIEYGNTQGRLSIHSHDFDTSEINRVLVESGIKVFEISKHGAPIEDFFIERMDV